MLPYLYKTLVRAAVTKARLKIWVITVWLKVKVIWDASLVCIQVPPTPLFLAKPDCSKQGIAGMWINTSLSISEPVHQTQQKIRYWFCQTGESHHWKGTMLRKAALNEVWWECLKWSKDSPCLPHPDRIIKLLISFHKHSLVIKWSNKMLKCL